MSRVDNPNSMANLDPSKLVPTRTGNALSAKHHGDTKTIGAIPGTAGCIELIAAGVPIRDPDGSLPESYRALCVLAGHELARYQACDRWVEEHGTFGPRGKLTPAAEHMRKTAKGLAELLDRLGCSPRSAASLGLDLKRAQHFDLAKYWQEEDRKT